jgi:hypothetical protein
MLFRVLFYFIIFYSLFKFLIRVVLPLLVTTSKVRTKMKDMRENRDKFEAQNQTDPVGTQASTKKETTPSAKGDYIDFEEVK